MEPEIVDFSQKAYRTIQEAKMPNNSKEQAEQLTETEVDVEIQAPLVTAQETNKAYKLPSR